MKSPDQFFTSIHEHEVDFSNPVERLWRRSGMKIRRVAGRRTRQTEETGKSTWPVAESAGMCAACRGDVSHPVESGQDLLKVLESNFVFDPIHWFRRHVLPTATGRFCRRAGRQREFCRRSGLKHAMRQDASMTGEADTKKGRSDSGESVGLFLVRRGHAVSHAAVLTLTCWLVSQASRRLSQPAAPAGGGAEFSVQRGPGSQLQASLSLDKTFTQH